MLSMEFSNKISDLTNRFLLNLQSIKLKSTIRDAIASRLHLSDNSKVQIEGTLMLDVSGTITPIILTFGDGRNSEASSQSSRTPSKRQQSAPCSDELISLNQFPRSESISPTPMMDCALDLTKGASVPLSLQETPVKQDNVPANEVMRLFQQNLFSSPGLPLYQSAATLPTILPNIQFEPNCVSPPLKKRKRVVGTSVRKLCDVRQFRCNQCDGIFSSLRDLECHTVDAHGGFKCHLCKKPFTQRSNLQRHALKHVDFKPFECILCEKAYYRKDHLMRHMQKTHPFHLVEENIRVKLRSSESLDYLRQINEDRATTNIVTQDEGTSNGPIKMEDVKGFESEELAAMASDTNFIESPSKNSSDFLSDESIPPNADEFTLPSSSS
ncbi:unnamed protein product [Hymenolepis diminuta]|uniref:C2H2-type domain-containing protein n=1 Tax=Hymenolepis diminuta TaxID=6216 RepID=A0A564YIY4_HYMDI|nr:unnamed protein product [Hymenolepis diminuta]